jgi:hypothetical protein
MNGLVEGAIVNGQRKRRRKTCPKRVYCLTTSYCAITETTAVTCINEHDGLFLPLLGGSIGFHGLEKPGEPKPASSLLAQGFGKTPPMSRKRSRNFLDLVLDRAAIEETQIEAPEFSVIIVLLS